MGVSVRVKDDGDLDVVGHGTIISVGYIAGEIHDYITVGTVEGAGPAYLHSLRRALTSWRKHREDPKGRVWVGLFEVAEDVLYSDLEETDVMAFSDEFIEAPPTNPALLLEEDRLLIRVETWERDEPDPAEVHRLLAPFLERHGASCKAAVEEHEGDEGFTVSVDIDPWPPRGATVADVCKLGDEARALLLAAKDGELPRPVALDLLRAGRWDLFHGQPESDWLEAKGEPYDHLVEELGNNWRYELAKDVAAFANSPVGGIIVIGMTTKDRGDGDTIFGHMEFDLRRVKSSTYRKHVAQLIYPRVVGFEVDRIEGSTKGRGLAVLVVPPQPESSRPFLVQGVISQGKALGGHVLIPERREDDTALMDAVALHARIRLGEQVIAAEKRL